MKIRGLAVFVAVVALSGVHTFAHAQGGPPDFVVTNVSGPVGSIPYYASVPVSFGLQNNGGAYTGNVAYEIAIVGSGGVPVVLMTGFAFMTGTSVAVAESPMLPPGLGLGTGLVVVVRVDPSNAVVEANETNNVAMSATSFSIVGADLRVSNVVTSARVNRGANVTITALLENNSMIEARMFVYRYSLTSMGRAPFPIFTSSPMSLAAGASVMLSDSVMIPVSTPLGPATVSLIADVTSVVPETSESNNFASTATLIVDPSPDFTIDLFDVPTMVETGQQIDIARSISNLGDAPGTTDFGIYLSSDAVITTQDQQIGMGTIAVAVGDVDTARVMAIVPSLVAPGSYYIGGIVDPANAVTEVDESNNTTAVGPVTVFPSMLQVATSALPDGEVGLVYAAELTAIGLTGVPSWRIVSGGLPPGIALGGYEFFGRPTTPGVYDFVVEVEDGNRTASAALRIRIIGVTEPLEILTPSLPTGNEGRAYLAQLIVVGGEPPYDIRVTGLPSGLVAAADQISGAPDEVGDFDVEVVALDALGNTASRRYRLLVVAAGDDLQFVLVDLPDAIVGEDYCALSGIELRAMGGAPPYSFTIVEGEVPGLMLASSGALCGTPTTVGEHSFVARVSDSAGTFDTARFSLSVSAVGLRVTTTSLGDALLAAPYTAVLEAEGGALPLMWSVLSGDLPTGMSLSADGTLSGTPETLGVYTFAVVVRDVVGAEHVAPLSIRVVTNSKTLEETTAEGCSCSSSGRRTPGGVVAVFLVLTLFVRRRQAR